MGASRTGDRGRAVTIRDVARAAGVSHQTIANVLKAPERVAPATRQRVERHIAALGFRPNRVAQNLSHGRSGLLGFRVEARSTLEAGGILSALLESLATAAEERDRHVVLFHSEPGEAEAAKAADLYSRSLADAFVLVHTMPGDARIPAFLDRTLRFVTFGRTDYADQHHWVDTDNVAGARLATDHVIGLGHRHIGFVGWPDGGWVGPDRLAGWRQAMAAHDLDATEARVARVLNDRTDAVAAATALLQAQPELTALVTASDELAVGAAQAADQLGRPISVVGYDDSPLAALGRGLTSIRQPIAQIAAELVTQAVALADGTADSPRHELLRPELVVRASTRPLIT